MVNQIILVKMCNEVAKLELYCVVCHTTLGLAVLILVSICTWWTHVCRLHSVQHLGRGRAASWLYCISEKDHKLAQKLGQLQPFIGVLS
jgi:hypothetical protein